MLLGHGMNKFILVFDERRIYVYKVDDDKHCCVFPINGEQYFEVTYAKRDIVVLVDYLASSCNIRHEEPRELSGGHLKINVDEISFYIIESNDINVAREISDIFAHYVHTSQKQPIPVDKIQMRDVVEIAIDDLKNLATKASRDDAELENNGFNLFDKNYYIKKDTGKSYRRPFHLLAQTVKGTDLSNVLTKYVKKYV